MSMSHDVMSLFNTSEAGFTRASPLDCATPFIEVDGLRLNRNVRKMQAIADAAGVRLRPHIKTHKSIEIARRQIEAGAAGLTASKATEAEVFLGAGFKDVLMAYPVIRAQAIGQLLKMAKMQEARVSFIAGDLSGVNALAEAAIAAKMRLPVFMKVDVGLGRIGVKPKSPMALQVAQEIAAADGLQLAGLLSHAGHSYGADRLEAIEAIAMTEGRELVGLRQRLEAAGITDLQISTGSTPTVLGAPVFPATNEIRPGNYAFLDLTALRLKIASPDDLALSVIATVVATNEVHAIIDAGSKVLSSDHGPHGTGGGDYGCAISVDADGRASAFSVARLSEEHGFLPLQSRSLPVGSRVRIFPNHSCAVVALSDSFVMRGSDGGFKTFPIDARGKLT
jgi:D-serine deaminase-like pyridoxal phosphate-dependent protein